MWWADLLWGFWNGLTAWIVLVVLIFGGWEQFPFYNEARGGNWYDFGCLLGAGSPPPGCARREGPAGLSPLQAPSLCGRGGWYPAT